MQLFEEAGAAGIHLEDQIMPKRCGHLSGKTLIESDAMEAKIRAACAARRDKSFFIIARTDARGVNGMADAVARANRYRAAGADAVFPEALENEAEFAQFAKESPGLLLANMTEFGKSQLLDAATLAKLGYRMILFPVSSLRMALKSVEELFAEIAKAGTQQAMVSRMLTRASLYELLGYTGYEERDRSYFESK